MQAQRILKCHVEKSGSCFRLGHRPEHVTTVTNWFKPVGSKRLLVSFKPTILVANHSSSEVPGLVE